MRKSLSLALSLAWLVTASAAQPRNDYFKITVVDEDTGRGVPLVELKTTGGVAYYTDSNGIVAFYEPSLMDSRVFFHIRSHGYECEEKFFDERGKILQVVKGGSAIIKIKRLNIAERLYRVTGEGIYRDSLLTGHPVPIKHPMFNGRVMGQDTVIVAPYRGKLYWFWGDTIGPADFKGAVAGATSEWPGQGGLDPGDGVDLSYFVNESGFTREMCPIPGPGLVWIEGLMTVKDEQGRERLLATYVRPRQTPETSEKGLAIFNDERQVFEQYVRFPGPADHRSAHPFRATVNGEEYFYYYPWLRVKADLKQIADPSAWEAFTCLMAGSRFDKSSLRLDRGRDGRLRYAWKAGTTATGFDEQWNLIAAKKIKPEEAAFRLLDVETGAPVNVGFGSLFWNEFRRRWILIAQQNVGGVWFAEADSPVGPWAYGRKIVSHDRYTFYNLTQHPFFDQDGGRLIYFEGTYTNTFSGNPEQTPRYNYNQIMYRLRLDDPRLSLPAPVYAVKGANGSSRYLMRDDVESQQLWEKVEKTAFFAVPPERKSEGLIPIYAVTEASHSRLQREPPVGSAQPLFYALPAAPAGAQENISGKWLCKLKEADGSDLPFTLELKLEGEQVTGTVEQGVITQGRFRAGKLELEVKTDQAVYLLTAQLRQRRLGGEWRIQGSDKRSDWSGEREVKPISTAIVPLYEYRRMKDGARFYSTEPSLPGKAARRAAEPLCRVWRNPMSTLIVDHQAKTASRR
jgi:hypothetical protein